MIARLVDLTRGLDTDSYRITIETNADVRELCDSLKGKALRIDMKEYKERRSLDANAYAWVLIDKLATALHKSKSEVYRETIRDVGGNSVPGCYRTEDIPKLAEGWAHNGLGWQVETFPSKTPGCTNVRMYYGSSMYDTEQMSRFIDLLVQECQQVGIPTDPHEVENMKEDWGKE